MSVSVTASQIMDNSAAFLNDTAKQMYSYSAQLPYLKIALKELRELFELNDLPVTHSTSAVLNVLAGTTSVGFATTPALPSDLVSIQELWEARENENNWILMTPKEFIPSTYLGTVSAYFGIWAWQNNTIKLPEADVDIDLKMNYIAELFTSVIDQNSVIAVINSELFLSYRTAALCAHYIGENSSRSEELNAEAGGALDRINGIENKGKQAIMTRRRPFRASRKARGIR